MRFLVTAIIFCVIAVAACEVATTVNSMATVYENGEIVRPVGTQCEWCSRGETVEREAFAFICRYCNRPSRAVPQPSE